MTVCLSVDPDEFEPTRRLYVAMADVEPLLFQDVETEDTRIDDDSYFWDAVQETVVHVTGGEDVWQVADVEGEFEWDRHRLWVFDRVDRGEWHPVNRLG